MRFRANYLPSSSEHSNGIAFLRSSAMQALIEELKQKYVSVCQTGIDSSSDYLSRNLIPHTRCEASTAHGAIIETKDGPMVDVASQTVNTVIGQNDIWVLANINAFNLSGYPSFLSSRFSNVYAELLAEQLATVGEVESARVNHRLCSGAAAVESLLTNAWNHRCTEYGDRSSRTLVGSFKGGFHGQTGDAGRISWIQKGSKLPFQTPGISNNNVLFLETPTDSGYENTELLSCNDARILDTIRANQDRFFLLIIEPILMNYGVSTPSAVFLRELRKVCEECQIPLAFDEIQTAFGWVGEMSASERVQVKPDMLAVSKGLTGGYGPLAASICNARYSQERGTGESTNGSDLRAMIAARAVFERLKGIPKAQIPAGLPDKLAEELEGGLLRTVAVKAKRVRGQLAELVRRHEGIVGTLRGEGLIVGIPLKDTRSQPSPALAAAVYQDLIERGVFARASHDAIILKPPLVITDTQIEFALDQLDQSLRHFSAQPIS